MFDAEKKTVLECFGSNFIMEIDIQYDTFAKQNAL